MTCSMPASTAASYVPFVVMDAGVGKKMHYEQHKHQKVELRVVDMARLTRIAQIMVEKHLLSFPQIRLAEYKEHGFDPLLHPNRFMRSELMEPEHAAILEAVAANNGVISKPLINWWIRQNLASWPLPAWKGKVSR